jgi:hypothetical protein
MALLIFLLVSGIQDNLIDEALEKVGLTREDLGYRPKGYWIRYPLPDYIPHKLPFFDDLFEEPLKIYDFTKSLAYAGEKFLSPKYLDSKSDALYQLVYFLGVNLKVSGFRNFGSNIFPRVSEMGPLEDALVRLFEISGNQMNVSSFGARYDSLLHYEEIRKFVEEVPETLHIPLSEIILNLLDAYKFWLISVRNVDPEDMIRVFYVRDFPETQSDGSKYYPEFDDVVEDIDEHSLYYCALKSVDASFRAFRSLKELKKGIGKFHASLRTPLGVIEVGGTGNDTFRVKESLLVLDMGGSDLYMGSAGATHRPFHPISVLIDLEGDDVYKSEEASQGCGILGVGILIDGEGNDYYKSRRYSQGMGVFGLGLLFDGGGNDRYEAEVGAQGCGFFGIGILAEGSGDDSYYIYGNGQGDGEFGGIGILVDRRGNDSYKAEPYSEVFDRGDYHSNYVINANNSQGFGGGRRGDGSDGHSWAGGLGALIDIEGNDSYLSGNWSLGTGYWYGVGLLYDGSGDDIYSSCYFTQASGAHFSIGALIDEGGNDEHKLFETAGAALAFGWDFTVSLFLDKEGDDEYVAKIISIGVAQVRSNALFFDLGGDDIYKIERKTEKLGAATFREEYRTPNPLSPYFYYANSIALFIDRGGKDTYIVEGERNSYGNNSEWLQPSRNDPNFGFNNFGIGIDRDRGEVEDFFIFDKK